MEEIPSSEDKDQENAEPGWLVEGEREEAASPVVPPSGPAAAGEAYEVLGGEPDGGESDPVPPIVPPIPTAPRPAKAKSADAPRRPAAEAAAVDVVWTRWGEWWPDLARLGVVALATAFLLYLLLGAGYYSLAFLTFIAGLAAMAVLSYPLAITLERPVRVTPEQAVRDFYGAVSHNVPHYRRMWLLLSSAGRSSPEFVSFEGFRSYWKATLAALDDGVAGRFNPLLFDVEDFRSEKSAGQTAIDATFTLKVRHRRFADRPARTFRVEIGLARGPDRMWYLNQGTLPKA